MLTADGEIVLVPARFNERLIAYIIDGAPLMAGYVGTVLYAPPALLGGPLLVMRNSALIWIAVYVVYQFLGNLAGGTIGKRLMGLRVVAKDGEGLGFVRSLVRAVGHLISTPLFNFGFLVALVHPENRALHDLLSGSVVVEPQQKHPSEAVILFIAAVMTLGALYGLIFYINIFRPTPEDAAAVEKARDGLGILAQIEEVYKTTHSSYTDDLVQLAQASGDPVQFRAAMKELFDPNQFELQAGNRAYRISARALDRRRTKLIIEGPPPRLVPR